MASSASETSGAAGSAARAARERFGRGAVQPRERAQRVSRGRGHRRRQLVHRRMVLVAQREEEVAVVALAGAVEARGVRQRPVDTDVAEVEMQSARTGGVERGQQHAHHFAIGVDAGVPVQLAADLHDFARDAGSGRHGAQHASRVAQAGDARLVQQMRVDARDLRRRIGAHAEHAPGQRVHGLERLQVEIAPGAGQQRVEILDERRAHQAIAARAKMIEQRAAQRLDARRLRRQHVLDRFGQQPLTHG